MPVEPDTVSLTLPARPECDQIVRVGGAAIGLRCGFSFAEIDELRTAIDGAIELLLSSAGDEQMHIEFVAETDELRINLTRPGVRSWPDDAVAVFQRECSDLVSGFTLSPADGQMRLTKQRARAEV